MMRRFLLACVACLSCLYGKESKAETVIVCNDVITTFILGYVYRIEGFASLQQALLQEISAGHCIVATLKRTLVVDGIAERYITSPEGQEQLLFSVLQTQDGKDFILSFVQHQVATN